MKRLIAAVFALIASGITAAEESQAAGFPNNAGGWTIITTRSQYCAAMNMYDGYAYAKDGAQYTKFCWTRRGDAILAILENNETRQWHVQSFELLGAEPEINNNKS